MWVEPEALREWDRICPDQTLSDLRGMVRRAAPVTHPLGNRRFEDMVFDVTGGTIVWVAKLSDAGVECHVCGGRGYTMMHDDFTKNKVQVPCHDCSRVPQRRMQ